VLRALIERDDWQAPEAARRELDIQIQHLLQAPPSQNAENNADDGCY
jgi:hypothetical protein